METPTRLMLAGALLISTTVPCHGASQTFPGGFHNGGTGACDGCHSRPPQPVPSTFRNNTTAGATTATAVAEPRRGMLNGSDPSSTCLLCHAAPAGQRQPDGYFVATTRDSLAAAGMPPMQLTPGGDFGWLFKTYTWSSQGGSISDGLSEGERHGHNIVATQFGYIQDSSNFTAPGGTYPADQLSCTSCHDPHGNYRRKADGTISTSGPNIKASGSSVTSPDPDPDNAVGTYRMLAGIGYLPKILAGDLAFKEPPPAAIAPVNYNRAETISDTRVAYGAGMSEWCRNCHLESHKNGGHPAGANGKFSTLVLNIYNRYVGSGKSTGVKEKSYSSLVPFEMGTSDYSILKAVANSDGSNTRGPDTASTVTCLTCHRAHASGWDYMGRWNMKAQMLTYEGKFVGTDIKSPPGFSQGRQSTETRKAYYDRAADSFSAYQRGLCSKCHEKD